MAQAQALARLLAPAPAPAPVQVRALAQAQVPAMALAAAAAAAAMLAQGLPPLLLAPVVTGEFLAVMVTALTQEFQAVTWLALTGRCTRGLVQFPLMPHPRPVRQPLHTPAGLTTPVMVVEVVATVLGLLQAVRLRM